MTSCQAYGRPNLEKDLVSMTDDCEKCDAGVAADLAAEVIDDLKKLFGGSLAKDANSAVFKAISKLVEIEAALRRIERSGGDGPFPGPAGPGTAVCQWADDYGVNSSSDFRSTVH